MASEITYSVRSNIDALSASTLHDALKRMVSNAMRDAGIWLRADRAAHSRSGALARHVKDGEVEDVADLIQASLGVTAVEEADVRPSHGIYRRSSYPLFVEGGTHSPIFSPRGAAMWNPREGIFGRMTVSGQHPQEFMLKTYELARQLVRFDTEIAKALAEMGIKAEAMAAAMRLE